MTEITACDFLVRHPPAEHSYLEIVHEASISGACVADAPPKAPISCDRLLAICRDRAEHLARCNGPHARRLRDDVLSSCERLAASPGATAFWWNFRMRNGLRYGFIEHSTSRGLLGALCTVRKLEVSAEEWERLWAD